MCAVTRVGSALSARGGVRIGAVPTTPPAHNATPAHLRSAGHFTHRGYRLAYETHGRGARVFVLLPGLLLDSNLNRPLAAALAGRGNRVVLLEFVGHGGSDRPRHATDHRIDRYTEDVVALLDHLGVDQAVVGGPSLGANVALQVAATFPDRVRALFIEMPVTERGTVAAMALFWPLLMGLRYLNPAARVVTAAFRRMPRTGFSPVDSFINAFSGDPRELAAVLHGVMVGPVVPPAHRRRELHVPALVIGHKYDLLHPMNDAQAIAAELPDARLVGASSMLELRARPQRLLNEIASFLDEVWAAPTHEAQA